jgi:CheY-like chemotaxis protein
MSHEIRTPMNAILGITQIHLRNTALPADIKGAFSTIYNSGMLLLGIINDILDLSKIEAGKMELVQAKYDVAGMINDAAQMTMLWIENKALTFVLHVDENIPSALYGDELRIKQILNNLLSNAFKYTDKGSITLSVAAESGSGVENSDITLAFRVEDTGQGMTAQQVQSLFAEYSRFNLEANRAIQGAGLGMSITQKFIRLMHGEIFVESEPGKGSTFTVHLPQKVVGTGVLGKELARSLMHFDRAKHTLEADNPQIAYEPMPYGRVLVVDDVDINLYVAEGVMSPYELSIDVALSGVEAIAKIQSGNVYDIVFMDYMMPQMDGVEATKILRASGYTRPIVALSANALNEQVAMFLANGFDDFIAKPIDAQQIDALLNKLIRDKHR